MLTHWSQLAICQPTSEDIKQHRKEKVLYKPREKRSLKRCVIRFFVKEERDGELRTIVG